MVPGEGKGMNLAQKMLEKFGWKEGEGLGKERQGIATPLIAQKTDNRSAVIVKAKHLAKPEPSNPPIQVNLHSLFISTGLLGPSNYRITH